MIQSLNKALSFEDREQMVVELEQRNEFTCTANNGKTCPSGACGIYGESCINNH